jgi:dihydrofolate synthase/folylpolyglutamate synthase
MALIHFAQEQVDVAVLEVGRGGTYDAVNVAHHEVSLMAPIDLDHTDVLGETIEAIAVEKAGVVTSGGQLVTACQPDEALPPLRARCMEQRATWWQGLPDGMRRTTWAEGGVDGAQRLPYLVEPASVTLPLGGPYQRDNLRLALASITALAAMGWSLDPGAVRRGLETVSWPGRFEVVHQSPLTLVDGAHNPEAARRLREAYDEAYRGPVVWVVGVSLGKDLKTLLCTLRAPDDILIATQSRHPRALSPEEVAEAARCAGFTDVTTIPEIRAAWEAARRRAGKSVTVCFTGSLHLVAEARELFDLAPEAD